MPTPAVSPPRAIRMAKAMPEAGLVHVVQPCQGGGSAAAGDGVPVGSLAAGKKNKIYPNNPSCTPRGDGANWVSCFQAMGRAGTATAEHLLGRCWRLPLVGRGCWVLRAPPGGQRQLPRPHLGCVGAPKGCWGAVPGGNGSFLCRAAPGCWGERENGSCASKQIPPRGLGWGFFLLFFFAFLFSLSKPPLVAASSGAGAVC